MTNNILQRCEQACDCWIVSFLNNCGVEDGNGLTSLERATFNKPAELSAFVVDHYKPPLYDNRDLSPAGVNESDYGKYSYGNDINAENSVFIAFITFLGSSLQIVVEFEPGRNAE